MIRHKLFYFCLIACYHLILSLDIKQTLLKTFQKRKTDVLADLKNCKVTHSGVEYEGNIAQTKSGILCQNWETPDPIHKIAEQIVDADFPEGSKKKAKNYCRNPQHWGGRPWCYTLAFNVTKEDCFVPYCSKELCRITGPGVEYTGFTHSVDSKECLYWSDIKGTEYKQVMYDSIFPDGSRKKAENRCRNPDSDVGGPWCFVDAVINIKRKNLLIYEKAYCGIPLCESKSCMTATTDVSSAYKDYHTVFSLLPHNTTAIDFSVKLWSPDKWHIGELKLALTVFPIPATGSQMRAWKTGIEVIISTYKSGLTPEPGAEPDWNVETGLLSGTEWRDLELSWTGGFISLKRKNKVMSVFSKDYTENENDLSRDQFKYYSIRGSDAMWNFPFCSADYVCEEHVTTHGDFERRWPLTKSRLGSKLTFFVRGFHSAIIEMKSAAMLQYPSIQLILFNIKNGNLTSLTLKEYINEERITIEEIQGEPLSFWQWKEFSINIEGSHFELFFIKDSRNIMILSASDPHFKSLKYFSIGSRHSTVYWTLNCSPPLEKRKIPAELPECIMNEQGNEFSGYQSVTSSGLPCIPWSDKTGLVPQDLRDSNFIDGSKEDAKNYCRNPLGLEKGPFCYVVDLDTAYTVTKQNCFPRLCRSKECRMAGTGNDYIGVLNITASGRTCQRWTGKEPHSIPKNLLNKEMFPELSMSEIHNFCRNPSHDSAGPWCFTTDSAVDTDLCDVPDCDVLGACKVVAKGNHIKQSIFILPSWKSNGFAFKVKSWDPKYFEGIRFVLTPYDNTTNYKLDFGSSDNDKIILYYTDVNGKERIVKQKALARVIPSGSWVGFVLTFGVGEVNIYFENVHTPFFTWKSTYSENVEPLYPSFLSYSALSNKHSVGIGFNCEECHTHINRPGLVENIYPLNWWNPWHHLKNVTKLKLNVRGVGTFLLMLLRLEDPDAERILLEIHSYGRVVAKDQDSVLVDVSKKDVKMFTNSSWTNYTLSFTENSLTLVVGNITVVEYSSKKPLIFYFFTLSVSDGLLIWNANCDPPNLDASPINGGWSHWGPWQCSVSCGGGHGKRRRLCNRPLPNIQGQPCNGSDVMEGVCNDFKCGDVPLDLLKTIETHTRKQAHNIRKHLGENLTILCDSNILRELKDKAPKTKVEWTKDGVPLHPSQEVGRIRISQFTIERSSVYINDSGIYICALEDRKGQRAIIRLTSVTVVTNDSTRVVREGSSIILDCFFGPLSLLFVELTQFWTLNGQLYQDYGATSHSLMDIDLLFPVNPAHEGEWECILVQVQYNLTWVTAWFRLHVKKNTILAIMFDSEFIGKHFRPFGNNPIVNTIIAFALLLLVVLFIVSFAFYSFKILKPSKNIFYRKKKHLIRAVHNKKYQQFLK